MRATTEDNMNSELNPQAPEFVPDNSNLQQGLLEDTKDGYQAVQKTIKASNLLPKGASYERFKIYTDFNVVTSQLTNNVIDQSNTILATERLTLMVKSNDPEVNDDRLIETNDIILDRSNTNIDVVVGIRKNVEEGTPGYTSGVSSWNLKPIITRVEVDSAVLFGAQNILRPQLNFKVPIDNSASLWVPKITEKPNNIAPLALKLLYNDDQVPIGYEHPYKMELDKFKSCREYCDKTPIFPKPLAETKYTYIDTEEQLDKLIKHLLTCNEIAVDLEHHSYRSYQGITCLIQLTTTSGGDFIIDALATRDYLHKLNLIFTNPKKLKVFHGASSDIVWLQRDFGVYVVGLFDTFQAARILNFTGLSLKHLLMRYCQIDVDKRYQLADWRIRPLPDELINYARMDTHFLLYISERMRFDLLHTAKGKDNLLMAAFEQSRQTCLLTYSKEVVDENSHLPLYVKSKKNFNSQQLTALKLLYKWRDDQARLLDESTAYLLPNHMLLTLAETLPREVQGVDAICNPMPPFVKQNIITLHRMILSCRALPLEPELHPMPKSINAMLNHQQTSEVADHDHFMVPELSEDTAQLQMGSNENLTPKKPGSENVPRFSSPYVKGSDLNADAKCFSPPYTRYKKYRVLARNEEIEEFKQDQAKATPVATTSANNISSIQPNSATVTSSSNKNEGKSLTILQRKRKNSTEIVQAQAKNIRSSEQQIDENNVEKNVTKETVKKATEKPYEYSKVNLNKFYDPNVKNKLPKKEKNKTNYKKQKNNKKK